MNVLSKQRGPASLPWDQKELHGLLRGLRSIRSDLLDIERRFAPVVASLYPDHRESARNLLHYLALRRHDVRAVQEQLANLGLSSLGRSESHVLENIDAVIKILCALTDRPWTPPSGPVLEPRQRRLLLSTHADRLLGPSPSRRRVRIMVTMPSEAAADYPVIRRLLEKGMDCMRINCAHDNAQAWEQMIANLRRAEIELGKRCKIMMDLPGPKLRTGPLAAGPKVVKWRPRRDVFGNMLAPASIFVQAEGPAVIPPKNVDGCLQVSGRWIGLLKPGDTIDYIDARGADREMSAVRRCGGGWLCGGALTSYVNEKTVLRIRRKGRDKQDPELSTTVRLDESTAVVEPLLLKCGDILRLTSDQSPGGPAVSDANGAVVSPAHIPCSLPEVFADVRPGDHVWFDDGKIGGVIKTATGEYLDVEITNARPKGERLRGEKGSNFPDSRLRLPSLSPKDIEDLSFVVKHADIVGLSFVQHVGDVYKLQKRLAALGGAHLGIVLKVETRRGFELLPDLMLAAMRSPSVGVMIARGDLAVECGYQRLAEVQEEILWICEAAHMPVIWATQVLESLAKQGVPSRAEITDAAMGQRAECVMLNKGPHIEDAIRVLDDILRRMQEHQRKKHPMLRRLRWWTNPAGHLHYLKPPSPATISQANNQRGKAGADQSLNC